MRISVLDTLENLNDQGIYYTTLNYPSNSKMGLMATDAISKRMTRNNSSMASLNQSKANIYNHAAKMGVKAGKTLNWTQNQTHDAINLK